MDEQKLQRLFQPLYDDLRHEELYPQHRPLLAHYTSVEVLESVLKTQEVWFSNPLFMNDLQEVRFGIFEGARGFFTSSKLEAACGTMERANRMRQFFRYRLDIFERQHVLDLYVFCFSEYAEGDNDGLLSMWRGYGANGNGVAIVFDTGKLVVSDPSPLILSKVYYGTADERVNWIEERINQFAKIIENNSIEDDEIEGGSYYFLERLKLFSLFAKHQGFSEEREWRVAYLKDRDRQMRYFPMLSYWIGPRGVEPKLKFKFEQAPELTDNKITFSDLIHRIILGPSLSSPITFSAIMRMLEACKMPELKERVVSSSIPFRAIR